MTGAAVGPVIGGKPTTSFVEGVAGAGGTVGAIGLGASGDVTVAATGFRPSRVCEYIAAAAPPSTTITARTIQAHLRPAGSLLCCDCAMAQHNAEDDALPSALLIRTPRPEMLPWAPDAGGRSLRTRRRSSAGIPPCHVAVVRAWLVATHRVRAPRRRDRPSVCPSTAPAAAIGFQPCGDFTKPTAAEAQLWRPTPRGARTARGRYA